SRRRRAILPQRAEPAKSGSAHFVFPSSGQSPRFCPLGRPLDGHTFLKTQYPRLLPTKSVGRFVVDGSGDPWFAVRKAPPSEPPEEAAMNDAILQEISD